MEAKKIKLEDVEAGTIAYDLCKKEFVKAVENMKVSGYDKPELAVPFYVYTEQQFKAKKKPLLLMTLGLRKQPWTPYINKKKKDSKEKKKMLVGTCFLENSSGKYILRLQPETGAAKLNIIIKGAKDFCKKAKINIDLAKGAVITDETQEAETDATQKDKLKYQLEKLENDIQTSWSVIVSNYKGLATIEDKTKKAKSIITLFGDISQLESMVTDYKNQKGDIAKLLPQYVKNIDSMKANLEKSPKIKAMKEAADAIKARIDHLNSLLEAAGLKQITY